MGQFLPRRLPPRPPRGEPVMTPEELRRQRALSVAPLAEERAARRALRREQWISEGAYLTWDEVLAGEPCRGCGEPVLRKHAPERSRAREMVEFQERHSGCATYKSAVEVGGIMHCGDCCPPLPLSPGAHFERSLKFSMMYAKRSTKHLRQWDLTLSCGHTIQRSADWQSSFEPAAYDWSPVYPCSTCGEERAIIVASKLGPGDSTPRTPTESGTRKTTTD